MTASDWAPDSPAPKAARPSARAWVRDWWRYGTRTRWTAYDYRRHFGFAAAGALLALCGLILSQHVLTTI